MPLVEGPDPTGRRWTGRTRGNRVCIFDAHPAFAGTLQPLRIERASVSTLYGELQPDVALQPNRTV